jgi:hypothetical protein
MHNGRCRQSMLRATGLKLASASRQYILNLFTFSTIGERNEESFRRSKNIHWCSVELA